MKNRKSTHSGNEKTYKIITDFFGTVPARFNFVPDSTNELERQYFKKRHIKWIVKNTFMVSLAGLGLLSSVLVSCEKEETASAPSSLARGEKGGGTKTCQSVMIAVEAPSDIIIGESQVWRFDKQAAAMADFGWNDCATLECREQAEMDARGNRCAYWNMDGHPYWNMTSSSISGNAVVTVNATIISESFMLGGKYKENGKYSFSVRNPNGTSRLTNLTYSVDGGPPVVIGHTVVDGDPAGNNCLLGSNYITNNGPYGNSAGFPYLKSNQTIGAILASDDNPSNDAGCPGISIAVADPIELILSPGDHTIIISGVLNGNDVSGLVNVSQSKILKISAMGCEGQ